MTRPEFIPRSEWHRCPFYCHAIRYVPFSLFIFGCINLVNDEAIVHQIVTLRSELKNASCLLVYMLHPIPHTSDLGTDFHRNDKLAWAEERELPPSKTVILFTRVSLNEDTDRNCQKPANHLRLEERSRALSLHPSHSWHCHPLDFGLDMPEYWRVSVWYLASWPVVLHYGSPRRRIICVSVI